MNTSKRLLLLMSFVLSFIGVKADEVTFSVPDFSIEPGKTQEISLVMTSTPTMKKFNFNGEIILDEGLTFVSESVYDEDAEEYVDLYVLRGDRLKNGHVVDFNLKSSTDLSFIVNGGTKFYAYNEGTAVIKFKVKAADTLTPGTYNVKLSGMSAAGEEAVELVTSTEYTAKATVTKDCNITISVNNAAFGTATLNPAAGTHKSGTSFTATATPATGYKFVKWSDGSTTNPYTFTLENDLDLKAEFEIQKFTIAFYEEDGTTKIEEKVYDYNSAITAPSAATKEGYTFAGWTPALPEKATADGTYKATYTINKYKVKFVKDDGTTVVSESELEYGATITAPANPTKEGHTFKAWSPAVDATVPAKDVTYKATYTVNKYKVAFVAEGTTVKEETLDFGTAITAPEAPAKEGYTFKSWGDVLATVPAQDVTYTAQYEINKYKVIYKVDGAEYQSVDVEFNAAITAIAAPTREGYTFSGWSAIPATMPAENVTVTGSFTVNQYKVTFVAEGTTVKEETLTFVAEGTTVKEETLDFGTTITAPEAPAKEGYTFKSWGDVPITTVPAQDVTYTAQYEINKYKVIYKVDGAEHQSVDVEFNAAITAIAEPTKEGYTFSGWSAIPATMPAENVTVTGSLTFVAGEETVKEETLDFGTTITAPEAPAKEGFVFAEWENLLETVPANDVVFEAIYEEIAVIEPVETETEVDFAEDLMDEDGDPLPLGNTVINGTYYNFDSANGDGYDAIAKCLVLNTATTTEQMAQAAEAELGTSKLADNFAGIILSVKGEGCIGIDVQTLGTKQLMVKVGNGEPQAFTLSERGLAEFRYDTAEDTPVYIYAVGAGTDAVKIYSFNIVPGPAIPSAIKAIQEAIEQGNCYTLDGRKLNDVPTQKGIYIINGKKVMIK